MIRPTQIDRTRAADERAIKVYQARQRGRSFRSISTELGVSASWTREMFKRGRRVLQGKDEPLNELSTRVRNVLCSNDCGNTPEEISRWFAAQSDKHIRILVNFGVGSRKELSQWLTRHGQQPLRSEE
jgi:hypothetical protein